MSFHKHKCKFCSFVWEHHDINDRGHGTDGSHECPCCHRCNWGMGIYVGSEEPRVRNGVNPPSGVALADVGEPGIHPDQNHTFGD